MNCNIRDKNASTDLILLHGFNSDKRFMDAESDKYDKLDYNIISCDAIGHGSRKLDGSKCAWKQSADEIIDLIDNRQKPTILIGNSLGGAEALHIASNTKFVKKVFAISAPYDNSFVKDSNLLIKSNLNDCEDNMHEIEEILPNKIIPNKNVEYYFVHSDNDSAVLKLHLNNNIKHFNVPKDHILLYKYFTPGFISHLLPYYNDKTHKFIKENL